MTKLYYTEDGKLLYSNNWPEIPQVQASAYKDMILMAKYEREMKFMLDHPVIVTNPDVAFGEIVWGGNRIERERFYEIDMPVKITGPNTCEIESPYKLLDFNITE